MYAGVGTRVYVQAEYLYAYKNAYSGRSEHAYTHTYGVLIGASTIRVYGSSTTFHGVLLFTTVFYDVHCRR